MRETVSMKEGFYLCTCFNSGYGAEYVYERDMWLKKGLVLTDDNRALIRLGSPNPNLWISESIIRIVNGERFRTGPWPEERPSEPLAWYPFCVEGKWGVGDAETGEVKVAPQWAFCDCFIQNYARFSAKGDFSDLSCECYDGAFGMYDEALDMVIPPIYQHLSSMQGGVVLAKKDNLWGAFSWPSGDEEPAIPCEWDHMTFAQEIIVAMKNTRKGPHYTLFYADCYGSLDTRAFMDGVTSVTVPEGEPWDGYHFRYRLIERDGRWGVLYCPTAEIIAAPTLCRKEAEEVFWENEGNC